MITVDDVAISKKKKTQCIARKTETGTASRINGFQIIRGELLRGR